jgi:orotidine-5'-phosphate decarboxylase
MNADERLIVALDVNTREAALKLISTLRPRVRRYKVGLELFTACGPALVREIPAGGGQVFLDLKLHDIPNTAARAAVEAARIGVGMFTIHLAGGLMMARRVADEVEACSQIYRIPRPQILGVTVLTSLAAHDLEQVGVTRPVEEQVAALAALAKQAGLDGVVASAREVRQVREAIGPDMVIVTPGVRPQGADADDQARTMTPAEAMEAGADYIVVGRPIRDAADPRAAAASIQKTISGVFAK